MKGILVIHEDRVYIYYDILEWAVKIIEKYRLGILAQKKLTRLRLGKELQFLPGVGIEYQPAMERFYFLANQ